MRPISFSILFVLSFILFLPSSEAQTILRGGGATLPSPLYRKWIDVYQSQADVRISYKEIGSGRGVKLLLERQIDFGATDPFLTDEDLKNTSRKILHIPTCLGAVAISYNLPNNSEIKLTPELLARIFMGQVPKWSDSRISEINAGIKLPDLDITVIHRSDSSGTTFLFTDYLSKTSLEWRKHLGRGKIIKWPVGLGLDGNPGVTEYLKKIPGSIGYVSLNYARKNDLSVAQIQNASGNFITPTLESLSIAAAVDIPDDMRILLTDTPANKGYPITAFTYMIVYQEQNYNKRSRMQAKSLARFLHWMIHDGQQYSRELFYAVLPRTVVSKADRIIKSFTYNGKRLWKD